MKLGVALRLECFREDGGAYRVLVHPPSAQALGDGDADAQRGRSRTESTTPHGDAEHSLCNFHVTGGGGPVTRLA